MISTSEDVPQNNGDSCQFARHNPQIRGHHHFIPQHNLSGSPHFTEFMPYLPTMQQLPPIMFHTSHLDKHHGLLSEPNNYNDEQDDIEIVIHMDHTDTLFGKSKIFPNSKNSFEANDSPEVGLQRQLEYYFSRQNLANDAFLLSNMDQDLYVSIAVIAQFKRVREWTTDLNAITETLRRSSKVIVDETGTKVKPNLSLERTTVILRDVPESTEEEINHMLSDLDLPPIKNIRHDMEMWYITFESEEEALKMLYDIRGKSFKGKPLAARMKSEPTLGNIQARWLLETKKRKNEKVHALLTAHKTFDVSQTERFQTPIINSYNGDSKQAWHVKQKNLPRRNIHHNYSNRQMGSRTNQKQHWRSKISETNKSLVPENRQDVNDLNSHINRLRIEKHKQVYGNHSNELAENTVARSKRRGGLPHKGLKETRPVVSVDKKAAENEASISSFAQKVKQTRCKDKQEGSGRESFPPLPSKGSDSEMAKAHNMGIQGQHKIDAVGKNGKSDESIGEGRSKEVVEHDLQHHHNPSPGPLITSSYADMLKR
ncbi:hypothetical protein DFQ28_007658 [Apophysomyces sp. BC1034]|nr:hypothetical protein DFQ30_007523 [Apophysomyces sp. BC1015]KAG0176153.1 hypothetical protein DFQ29_006490 [Apophysomyces sp. BC1021]KAG0186527.1 hypothetical protein DFQ28_007658 [Apophysomyces sp. BC1034]